jgi:hypothetical protein
VLVQAAPDSTLGDRDLVTAIDSVALGSDGGWWALAYRSGDRPVYQVVRDGQTREVPVTLRRAEVADRLLQAWGTILFVVALCRGGLPVRPAAGPGHQGAVGAGKRAVEQRPGD